MKKLRRSLRPVRLDAFISGQREDSSHVAAKRSARGEGGRRDPDLHLLRVVPGLRGATVGVMSLARLKELSNRAVARRLLAANVAGGARSLGSAQGGASDEGAGAALERAEVHAFARMVRGDRLYAPFLLSLSLSMTGLRPAEVCGMRRADVDPSEATSAVADTRTFMGNTTVAEKGAKPLAGERRFPLPAPVRVALKCFRATRAAGERVAGGSPYLLPVDMAAPISRPRTAPLHLNRTQRPTSPGRDAFGMSHIG
ncbi:hypothetical protein ACWGKW_10090 [Streptomyces sp. NPDC054766]